MSPQPGYTTKVLVVDCHDGDTFTVEFKRKFDVRIRDINAPELKNDGGTVSRDFLKALIKGKEVIIFIPSKDDEKLMDFNSFGRVVADVYLGEENVGDLLVKGGHASFVGKDHHKVVSERV